MADRRGMLIKNVSERPVDLRLDDRTLHLEPGDERVVSASEVRQPVLRESLQLRTIAVVRPSTDDEAAALAENPGAE